LPQDVFVSIERSFQGLSGAIETIEIVKELIEIGLNKVCDTNAYICYVLENLTIM